MEVTNGTGQDARVGIVNNTGGAGADHGHHFRPEETRNWPILRSGESLRHDPVPPGPWLICFMVGDHQVVEEVRSASGQVRLLQAGASFRAHIG